MMGDDPENNLRGDLEFAMACNDASTVRLLLATPGIRLEVTGSGGRTGLHWA